MTNLQTLEITATQEEIQAYVAANQASAENPEGLGFVPTATRNDLLRISDIVKVLDYSVAHISDKAKDEKFVDFDSAMKFGNAKFLSLSVMCEVLRSGGRTRTKQSEVLDNLFMEWCEANNVDGNEWFAIRDAQKAEWKAEREARKAEREAEQNGQS